MLSASQSVWASVRVMSAPLPPVLTATMGITRTPARLTDTTVLATSPAACSSVLARGSTAASTGAPAMAVATVGTVVMAGAVARSAAAQFAAVAASTVVVAAVTAAADTGKQQPQPRRS